MPLHPLAKCPRCDKFNSLGQVFADGIIVCSRCSTCYQPREIWGEHIAFNKDYEPIWVKGKHAGERLEDNIEYAKWFVANTKDSGIRRVLAKLLEQHVEKCRTVKHGIRCKLLEGHEGNHQYDETRADVSSS